MTQAASDGSTTDHRPALTSLSDVFRNPAAEPLATVAATVVVAAGVYQTYHVATTRGWLVGALVALTFVLAYQLARRCWAVQNAVVAARLARLELDAECDEAADADREGADGHGHEATGDASETA